MGEPHAQLLLIERSLAGGGGDAYRRHLADDALVVVPGAVLDRETCAAAMDATPSWDEWHIDDARAVAVDEEAVLLLYSWSSRRGEERYRAAMTTLYALRDGEWRVVLHQQTPAPGPQAALT